MSSSGKFILCLAVVLCLIQAVPARPRMDGGLFEAVRYDLSKKCASLEKEMEKDAINTNHKIMKDARKFLKKMAKEGVAECVEAARLQAEEKIQEKMDEIQECIQEVRDSADARLQPDAPLSDIIAFRNESKSKLQICKRTGKQDLKSIQNNFSASGKACLL